MSTLTMTVNGTEVTRDIEANTLLVQFLREHLRLTGTHIGCDTTQCGACTVHLDGRAIKSCTMLAMSCDDSEVTTIEGIADGSELHPMQQAFRANHGLQCGYCTPGFVMSAIKIVERLGDDFDDHTLREELDGNICRCTGYHNIIKSVRAGAQAMQNDSDLQSASPAKTISEVCDETPPSNQQLEEFRTEPNGTV